MYNSRFSKPGGSRRPGSGASHSRPGGFVHKPRSGSGPSRPAFRSADSSHSSAPSSGGFNGAKRPFSSASSFSSPSKFGGAKRSFSPSRGGGFGGRGGFRGGRGGGFGGRQGGRRSFGGSVDVSLFVKKAVHSPTVEPKIIKHTFADFGFGPEVNKNLARKQYVIPTPIQDEAIPYIKDGRDLIGLANTGTGKTAAFLLPLIEKMIKNPKERVLVMAPTRELAFQIDTEFREFAAGVRLYSAVCVGGMPIYRQIQELRRGVNIVIGTPGRLEDLERRAAISFGAFTNVVLDEVDHMLDLGFIEPIRTILSKLPKERHSLFFSATMPPKIRSLATSFLKNPVTVDVVEGRTTDNVDQDVIRVKDKTMKFTELKRLLDQPGVLKVLIFCETKRGVQDLADNLIREKFKAESIHGDKRQRERARVLSQFRNNQISILVATDVAARGLDIKDITHVINYTIPQTTDDYIHRIGRTGRGGKKGNALTFI